MKFSFNSSRLTKNTYAKTVTDILKHKSSSYLQVGYDLFFLLVSYIVFMIFNSFFSISPENSLSELIVGILVAFVYYLIILALYGYSKSHILSILLQKKYDKTMIRKIGLYSFIAFIGIFIITTLLHAISAAVFRTAIVKYLDLMLIMVALIIGYTYIVLIQPIILLNALKKVQKLWTFELVKKATVIAVLNVIVFGIATLLYVGLSMYFEEFLRTLSQETVVVVGQIFYGIVLYKLHFYNRYFFATHVKKYI